MDILVLNALPKSKSTQHLIKAARDREHTIDIVDPADLTIHISNSRGHDRIYITKEGDRVFANSYDVVIPRIGRGLRYGADMLRHLTENMGIPSTASADGLLNAANKLKTTQLLSKARVPVPATTYTKRPENMELLLECVGGLPCIGKTQTGSQGLGVFVLETPLAAYTTLEAMSATRTNIILQEYIETTGDPEESKRDIRAIVTGDKVVGSMMRYSKAGDVRANYSISKKAEEIELTDEEKEIAVAASKACGLKVSGVDLMREHDTDRVVCIEVNGNMSLKGISSVTGRNIGIDIIKYAETLAKTNKLESGAYSNSRNYLEFFSMRNRK